MDFQFNVKNIKWMKGWMDLPECYYRIKTPSVTGIINDLVPDPGIEQWIKDVGEEKAAAITKAAQHRGTAMHIFIEEFLKELYKTKDASKALRHTQVQAPLLLEKENVPSDKIDKGRDLFYNFYESDYANSFLELVGTELPIYSPFLFFRGKADVVFRRTGKVASTDFKTASSYIEKGSVKEKKYKIQLGGYSLALDHMYKEKGIITNYASIISMHTKSQRIQVIECEGEDLEEKKREFETLAIEWHKNNNQSFLIAS